MPVTEQVTALGDWSVSLRADTPLSLRQAIDNPHAHIVITPARIDPALLSDASIRAAARYTGVVLRPGPQLDLAGAGLLWWLGDADNQPLTTIAAVTSATWATVYGNLIAQRFTAGTIASGGSYTAPVQYTDRRSALELAARVAGHEYRANPDFTFDADTVANLYGATPTVLLTPGGGGRDRGLYGMDAEFTVEVDWAQWGDTIRVQGEAGYADYTGTAPTARTPTGDTWGRLVYLEHPDVPAGLEAAAAATVGPVYAQPTRVVAATVRDLGLSDYLHVGDLVYVYDDVDDVRDLANQVQFAGRPIFPRQMRVTRITWPVQAGMGVYLRDHPTGGQVTYYDLSPYVEWEDGTAALDLVDGDANSFSLRPGTSRGDLVAQARDRAAAQPWSTYTPTWTGSTTNPAIGNGTLVGRYRRHGTTLHLRISVIPGSTTTFGSGVYTLGLPSGMSAATGGEQWVTAKLWDGSNWPGIATVSGSSVQVYFPAASGDTRLAVWQHNDPSAFANGHNLHIQGDLELAP